MSGSGTLSGIPGAAGDYSFTAQARDAAGLTVSQPLAISVTSGLSLTTESLPGGATGVAYAWRLTAFGGVMPYTWSVAGSSLPPGLTLSSSGTLSGTPTTYAFEEAVAKMEGGHAAVARPGSCTSNGP